ncbi:replication regulator protein [Venturia nashicola]|uniref:Replication regulator protein n=1 Tax=Venturia nashicola TaxID=86259 RepID=A0A4Z1P7P0_9PEZI|nr:replication regulator protein [Venturia nashicola]TLD26006.1 replication regulator protein [Venturia nashicola]
MSDEESGNGVPLIEPLYQAFSPSDKHSGKRKRDDEKDGKKPKKKKKTFKKQVPKDVDDDALDERLGLNLAIGRMDRQLLVDHVAQRTKRFEPELSTVEMEDRYLPANAVLDTSSWEEPRTLDNLPKFLKHFAKPKEELNVAPADNGSPHTILVALSGIRAAEVTRALKSFSSKESTVTKLFAKHIKLAEAVETCKKMRMPMGVGTPQRILELLEDGALCAKHLTRIVIDASHIDAKKRGILDMKELQLPLVKFLNQAALRLRYGKRETQIIFY